MGNFLEIFQGFKENSFSVQETSLINCFSGLQVMQISLWWGLLYFISSDYNITSTSQEFLGAKYWVNKGASY